MTNKKALIISAIVIVILAVAVIVLLQLYDYDDTQTDNITVIDNAISTQYDFNMLSSHGDAQDITASLKESGRPARTVIYKAVPLSSLASGDITAIVATAYDGVVKSYLPSQLSTLYIAFAQDDEPIGGKSDGGYGPFMIVDTASTFSTGWCKYLTTITIERGTA